MKYFNILEILLSNFLQFFLFFNGIFYLIISVLGSFLILEKTYKKTSPLKKFAILVPAHNEEKVISFFIESAINLNYPKNLYDTYIICDHCTDKTYDISKNSGVYVFNYISGKAGKATALNKATKEILKKDYDAICYFDADSLIHPDFLNSMNRRLNNKEEAIQARQLPKNPEESWLSRIISIGQYISNRFFQNPKSYLGLSATLHGKGIMLSRNIASKYFWDENCLTEDLEMQMKLIRNGIRIFWASEAIVYDEEPNNLYQYFKRTIRWTRGSLDTAKKHLNALLLNSIKNKDIKSFEAFLYSSNVYRFSLLGLIGILIYLTKNNFNFLIYIYHILPGSKLFLKLLFISPLIFIPFLMLLLDRLNFKLMLAYFLQPVLGFFRLPIFIAGIFKDRINWNRTEHTSSISINDIIKKENKFDII